MSLGGNYLWVKGGEEEGKGGLKGKGTTGNREGEGRKWREAAEEVRRVTKC